ncbi:MAG UNVERIFIED_CONTAM: hypothetical protein LVR18_25210 [Planctomycetaceae bacterium]
MRCWRRCRHSLRRQTPVALQADLNEVKRNFDMSADGHAKNLAERFRSGWQRGICSTRLRTICR